MKFWDKQQKEGLNEFKYFAHYRDSGKKRSLKSTAGDFKIEEFKLSEICAKRKWIERAGEYDKFIDSLVCQNERAKKNNSTSKDLAKTKNALDKSFALLINRIESSAGCPEIKTTELIRLVNYLNKTRDDLNSKKLSAKGSSSNKSFSEIAKIIQTDDKCLELTCELLKRYNEVMNERKHAEVSKSSQNNKEGETAEK